VDAGVEVFVTRLQEAIIDLVPALVQRAIEAEEDAVLVAQEKLARRIRLAAKLRDPLADIDVEVRAGVEDAANPGQIFRMTADVGANEGGCRRSRLLNCSISSSKRGNPGASGLPGGLVG
jgi:hypothetical protein